MPSSQLFYVLEVRDARGSVPGEYREEQGPVLPVDEGRDVLLLARVIALEGHGGGKDPRGIPVPFSFCVG